jgi:hypothetical protein
LATYSETRTDPGAPRLLAAYPGRLGRGGLLDHEEEVKPGRRTRASAGRQVPVNRYGLDGGSRAPARELSAKLGISEKAVRRVQRSAEHLPKKLPESGRGVGEATA